MRDPESWALESGIPLTIEIQNPSSTNKDWNPESTAWNPESNTVLDCLSRENIALLLTCDVIQNEGYHQGTHYVLNESRFKKKNVGMDPMYAEN